MGSAPVMGVLAVAGTEVTPRGPDRAMPPAAGQPKPARRRRSVSRMPALVSPIDIPEDAPGRVEIIAVRAPLDVVPPPLDLPASRAGVPRPGRLSKAFMGRGWLAVAVLGASLVLVFVIGMKVSR